MENQLNYRKLQKLQIHQKFTKLEKLQKLQWWMQRVINDLEDLKGVSSTFNKI